MNTHNLIRDIKAGKKEAFDQVYQEYHLILYRTAYLILGNPYDAEDILQETFVAAYTNIEKLKDEEKLKSWLFSILKNKAYSKIKQKNKELPDENVLTKVDSVQSEYSIESDFALKNEIQNCLMKLKPKYREVIVLYYYNDFSIEQISKICGSFQGTIKSRLYKARKELKKELEEIDLAYSDFKEEGIHEQKLESGV